VTYYWVTLLAIAVAVVFIAEKIKQPYPTLLVVFGLIVGVMPIDALDEVKRYAVDDKVFQTTIILKAIFHMEGSFFGRNVC
jgi:CPA1 family monovalent cation:H+ antiporter